MKYRINLTQRDFALQIRQLEKLDIKDKKNVRKGEKKRERGSQQHGQGEIERDKESGRERERGREGEAERERKIEGH